MCRRRSSYETHWFVGHADFIKGSGLDTLIFHSKLSIDGTSVVVYVNALKHSWYCLQVSVVVIYTLLKKAHVESGSALSVLDWLDEAAKQCTLDHCIAF